MDDFAPYQQQTESAFVEAPSISRLSVHMLNDIPNWKKADFRFLSNIREKKKRMENEKDSSVQCNLEFTYSARQNEIKNQWRSKLLTFGSEGVLPVRI